MRHARRFFGVLFYGKIGKESRNTAELGIRDLELQPGF